MSALTNPRWEEYAQARSEGLSQRKAYRRAFPRSINSKDETIDNNAYNLEKRTEIITRIQEIKEMAAFAAGGAVMNRNEKRKILAAMARDENLSPLERQKAIDIDNKMEDEYVQRVSAEVSNEITINIELVDD